ncbi:MAG: iron ABC transporter substrate-binding protein [Burkholderiales bacterium]|nr:iron ABC transporter substrate-binding protein [Burkholderiales bacterium]
MLKIRCYQPSLVAAFILLLATVAAANAEQRQFTDSTARTIGVPAEIERVYAAGGPASVMVYALAPDKLIGWTRAVKPAERPWFPERYANLPELGRLTGRGNTANVEVLLKARPDIVVDVGSLAPTFVSLAGRVQAQTGIPYLLFDGTLAQTAQTLRALGALLGEEPRAQQLAGYVDRTLSEIQGKVANLPAEARPRVYYARGPDGLQTGLAGSINAEVLDWLGARNVASAAGRGGLATVSLEQVLQWNPEVIVTIDLNFFEKIFADPRWRSIEAVKKRRVYLSPHLPFGWFDFPPSLNRLIGLQWLAQVFYPRLFDYDLRARTREFYRLFYHREPTAAQLDSLLQDAAGKR